MTKLPFPARVLDQHLIVLGKTRSGKSSTMRLMVEHLLDDKKPVCIVDPKGDWWGIKSSADGKSAGYEVVIFGGTHADVPITENSGKIVAELVATGNRPALIDLGGWTVTARTRFFIDFASTLFARSHGHRWLVIDECHNFAPQGKVIDPQAGLSLHWANRLASEGAGRGIVLISASQRPQKVHKDYVTSHETLIAKRVIHPLDRTAMKEWIDGCGDPTKGKEVIETLASLERAEGWVWSPEIGFGPKRVTFPMFSTYDSFAVQTGAIDRKLKGWASVNLDEVKSKLAAVVEEIKANDPKELRAEIAKLRGELQKAQKNITQNITVGADKDAIAAAEQRGFDQAEKKLRRAAEQHAADTIASAMQAMNDLVSPIAVALTERVRACRAQKAKLYVEFAPGALTPSAPTIVSPAARAPGPRPAPVTPKAGGASGALDRPLQRILDAIRWWNVMGIGAPSQVQAAFVAGYSHKSGTWATYLSRLRSDGLIEGRGDLILTPQGTALVNDPAEPPTGEALRGAVLAKIDGPLQRILIPILDAYPHGLSQQEAGEATGYSSSSGTWATYLSRLRTLDLIDGRGELRAQDWLFPRDNAAASRPKELV